MGFVGINKFVERNTKTMKKNILSVIICAAAVLSLTACGKNEEPLVGASNQGGGNSTSSASLSSAAQANSTPEQSGAPEESSAPAEPESGTTGFVSISWSYGRYTDYEIATTTELSLGSNTAVSDETPDGLLSKVGKLTNLTNLGLNFNDITDVTPLANLTNLTELWLDFNQISDIKPLANLTNLSVLNLRGNQISDVTPFANLTNLTELNLRENQISDVTPLANLTNLTLLDLGKNQISDEDKEWLKNQLPNCNIYF